MAEVDGVEEVASKAGSNKPQVESKAKAGASSLSRGNPWNKGKSKALKGQAKATGQKGKVPAPGKLHCSQME
jgi:hypothetical protein